MHIFNNGRKRYWLNGALIALGIQFGLFAIALVGVQCITFPLTPQPLRQVCNVAVMLISALYHPLESFTRLFSLPLPTISPETELLLFFSSIIMIGAAVGWWYGKRELRKPV